MNKIWVIAKVSLLFLGFLSLMFFVLSLTDLPYLAYHHLGTANAKLTKKPTMLVMLGGSGMPSPDGFMRAYYTYEVAKQYDSIPIFIALPSNESDTDSLYQLNMIRHELILHGIDSTRIYYETQGHSTYSQAQNLYKLYKTQANNTSVYIITSPEHMYRAVGTFRKIGFKNAGGCSSFEKPIESSKLKNKTKQKEVESLSLRYNMWSYMHYELLVLREYFAIAYYKIMCRI